MIINALFFRSRYWRGACLTLGVPWDVDNLDPPNRTGEDNQLMGYRRKDNFEGLLVPFLWTTPRWANKEKRWLAGLSYHVELAWEPTGIPCKESSANL